MKNDRAGGFHHSAFVLAVPGCRRNKRRGCRGGGLGVAALVTTRRLRLWVSALSQARLRGRLRARKISLPCAEIREAVRRRQFNGEEGRLFALETILKIIRRPF